MEPGLHWSVWLLSGLALGTLTGVSESALVGMLAGVGVLCSPIVIYIYSGTAIMPFALFFGGLIIASTIFFRRRNAQRNAKLRGEIDERNKRFGR